MSISLGKNVFTAYNSAGKIDDFELDPVGMAMPGHYIAKSLTVKNINLAEVLNRFTNKFPEIKQVMADTRAEGFLVAGGTCVSLALGLKIKDIDIFCIIKNNKLNRKERIIMYEEKVQAFVNMIVEYCGLQDISQPIIVTTKVVTLFTKKCGEVQIILNIYDNVSQLFGRFDIQVAEVGIDLFSQTLVMSDDAQFAYQTGYLTYCTNRRSPAYCYRLEKYCNKGFGLLMPRKELRKVKVDWVNEKTLQLPGITISFDLIAKDEAHASKKFLLGYKFIHKYSDFHTDKNAVIAINMMHNLSKNKWSTPFGVAYPSTHVDVFNATVKAPPAYVQAFIHKVVSYQIQEQYNFSMLKKLFGNVNFRHIAKKALLLKAGYAVKDGAFVVNHWDAVKALDKYLEVLLLQIKDSKISIDWHNYSKQPEATKETEYKPYSLDYHHQARNWLVNLVAAAT